MCWCSENFKIKSNNCINAITMLANHILGAKCCSRVHILTFHHLEAKTCTAELYCASGMCLASTLCFHAIIGQWRIAALYLMGSAYEAKSRNEMTILYCNDVRAPRETHYKLLRSWMHFVKEWTKTGFRPELTGGGSHPNSRGYRWVSSSAQVSCRSNACIITSLKRWRVWENIRITKF